MLIDPTPQELAAEILVIAEKGEHFNMNFWWMLKDESTGMPVRSFPAELTELDCGTTMCAAGWALHLTGWNLRESPTALATAQHVVTGEILLIENAAARMLDIDADQAQELFHTNGPVAIELLRQLAEGRPFDYDEAWTAARVKENAA